MPQDHDDVDATSQLQSAGETLSSIGSLMTTVGVLLAAGLIVFSCVAR